MEDSREKVEVTYTKGSKGNQLEFKCMYCNIRSLPANNKIDELKLAVQEEKYEMVAITETWLHQQIENAEINIPGYKIYRKDRNGEHKERGGGLILYVKENLKTKLIEDSDDKQTEALWITIEDNKQTNIQIGLFYKRPLATQQEKDSIFKSLRRHSTNNNCIILGDFNYPGINWTTVNSQSQDDQEFIKVIEDLYLTQQVQEPTRENNILDLIFTTDPDMISEIDILPPIGTSDHNTIKFNIAIDLEQKQQREEDHTRHDYRTANYDKINKELMEIDWTQKFQKKTTEEKWLSFKSIILQQISKHTKLLPTKKPGRKTAKWMNYKVKKEIKKRNRVWKIYKDYPTHENMQRYKKQRNITVTKVRKCKARFEENLAADIKTNPKAFYAYVNSKRLVRTNIGPLKDNDGKLTTDVRIMGNILNEYFASVFTEEDKSKLPELAKEKPAAKGNKNSLSNIDITKEGIVKAIKEMKENKTGGADNINSSFIKKIALGIVEPLELIFKESLKTGDVPRDWKTANVTAVFKKGNRSDAANYRPISLTSHFGKLMENLIKKNVVKFLEENNKISNSQHGFRQGRSCVTNLLEARETIGTLLDKNKQVDVIYLDFQKAFDKVPHQRLIIKLEKIGITGNIRNWINNWLTGRNQQVVIEGEKMKSKEVKSGVPQGSILGPVLFTIYVNDLEENTSSTISKFADDTKLIADVTEDKDVEEVKQDLKRIDLWTQKWQMECNADKSKVMHLGKKNKQAKYELQGKEMQVVVTEKDLGVMCKNDFKVDDQCAEASKKANRILGMIKRTITSRNKKIIIQLYKSLVRPHLDYCGVVWRPYLQKDIKKIEKIQRRTTKLIKECKGKNYEERLKEVRLTTLETRRCRADLIQTYRIIKGIDKINKDKFFTFSHDKSSTLRGNTLKIVKKRFNKTEGQFLFKNRIVNQWNKLSDDIVQGEGINNFKNKIDNYLRNNRGLI